MSPLHVQLAPEVKLYDQDGIDLTPKGRKELALCAILACSPEHSCTREHLRNLLWSDRSRDQSLVSLRQATKKIRKSLDLKQNVLISNKILQSSSTEPF